MCIEAFPLDYEMILLIEISECIRCTHTQTHTHPQAVHFHCDGVSLTITLNTNTSIAYH